MASTFSLMPPPHFFFFFFFFAELPRGPVGQIVCLEKEVVVLEKNRLLLWPQQGCCFSWGFPDNSCAFANSGADKVRMHQRVVTSLLLRHCVGAAKK